MPGQGGRGAAGAPPGGARRPGLIVLAVLLMAASGALAGVARYDGALGAVPLSKAAHHEGEEVVVRGRVLAREAATLEEVERLLAFYERNTGRRAPALDVGEGPALWLGDGSSSGPIEADRAYVLVLGARVAADVGDAVVATGVIESTVALPVPRLGVTVSVATLRAVDVHEPLVFT